MLFIQKANAPFWMRLLTANFKDETLASLQAWTTTNKAYCKIHDLKAKTAILSRIVNRKGSHDDTI
jgi:hypothetical protein